jgi:acetolactate decarboxylase
VIDERLIRALHVETLRRPELAPELAPHVVFQTSTIGALLQGAYDGDVTVAELSEHGDLGLGTLNALDGELIALDRGFFRADVDGAVSEIGWDARTPFAVVVPFSPTIELGFDSPVAQWTVLSAVDDALAKRGVACALRVDGDFELVRARSVPRQEPPYRPMTDVIAQQRVFELEDVPGTLVGFRFPDYSGAVEVSGFHLHFISADRRRGGHVLGFRARRATVRIDPSSDLHVELPPGVSFSDDHLGLDVEAAIGRVERQG